MIAIAHHPRNCQSAGWHAGFLKLLPAIERHAHSAIRHLHGEAKNDAVSEVIANCICAYHRLFERNDLHRAYASVLVRYAVALYYSGRRMRTPQCSHYLYSTRAREEAGVKICLIGTPRDQRAKWLECLTDNCQTPVPDQVHFRVEFSRWPRTQTKRNRCIAEKPCLAFRLTRSLANSSFRAAECHSFTESFANLGMDSWVKREASVAKSSAFPRSICRERKRDHE